MNKSIYLFTIALLLLELNLCQSGENLLPYLTQGNLFSTAVVPTVVIIRDSTDIYWTIFSSKFLGFHEFWLAYSHDTQNWSRPLYTGIPVLPNNNYQIKVSKHQIDFDWYGELEHPEQKIYYRSHIDTTNMGYTIYKRTLFEDTDADGLTDLAEDVLWTNRFKNDTDGDGKADGYDQNPLAAPANELSLHEKLHKAIIEYELEEFYSNQLVVVEQFENKPMEYERYEGIVLSFSSGGCDAFVSETGYGVPILSCTVKDTLTNRLKAGFQYFIAPENAWGYDVICRWSDAENDFLDFKIVNEWVSE
ncbi:hypothetical protein EH223_01260 [candidate division KSB1 bacterium]|nr:hypothetical protein [candidate division KSB1 bacterium]RQW06831.1 MAG: hypothetical protein EH223_01260 [candidate division KSB1 bacterium]